MFITLLLDVLNTTFYNVVFFCCSFTFVQSTTLSFTLCFFAFSFCSCSCTSCSLVLLLLLLLWLLLLQLESNPRM